MHLPQITAQLVLFLLVMFISCRVGGETVLWPDFFFENILLKMKETLEQL